MPVARALLAALLCLPVLTPALAQEQAAPAREGETMLMTIFLKHDQAKNLEEINGQLQKNGYYDRFPPPGTEVVSWYVVMGIGQVVTLRFPPSKLRDVNVALENTAWGPYRTEFYPTYDYKGIAEQQKRTMQARPKPSP